MKFKGWVSFLRPCPKPLKVASFLCFWRVCLNIVYPLMEARSCVHSLMAFKREVNGGKMATSSQGFIIKEETTWVAAQPGCGSAVIYRRQNETPFPSHLLPAANDNQTTLRRTPHVCLEARDWLDQFCPLLTNLKHIHVPPFQQLQSSPPKKQTRSIFSF